MKGKKGGATAIILFMALSFVLIIFSISMLYIANVTKQKLLENAPTLQKGMNENVTNIINKSFGDVTNSYEALKWITIVLIFGFALSIFVTSFLVKSHPVFFIPYFLILIIAVVVSAPISNAYEVIYNDATLGATAHGFFGASWIMLHLPIWVTIIGIASAILMFAGLQRSSVY